MVEDMTRDVWLVGWVGWMGGGGGGEGGGKGLGLFPGRQEKRREEEKRRRRIRILLCLSRLWQFGLEGRGGEN